MTAQCIHNWLYVFMKQRSGNHLTTESCLCSEGTTESFDDRIMLMFWRRYDGFHSKLDVECSMLDVRLNGSRR